MKTAAIIGCGKRQEGKTGFAAGHAHANNYRQAFPDIELIGVDISEENLKAFGEAFDVPAERLFTSTEAMYSELVPDAVSITTWPPLHCPQTIEAAKAGVKAITCEKPMALDIGEIDMMMAACAKHGSRLSIAHQRCYEWAFIKMKELLDAGAIGQRLVFHGRVGDGWDILSWSVHWFDMARFLFGRQPTAVLAGMDHRNTRRYGHAVEDNSVLFVEFGQHRQANFVTGPAEEPGPMVSITGERGMIAPVKGGVAVYNQDGYTLHEPTGDFVSGHAASFIDLWKSVEDPSYTSEADAVHTAAATRLAYAAHESARTMKRIELPVKNLDYAPLEVAEHAPTLLPKLGKVVLVADNHHADPETGEGGREGLADSLRAMGIDNLHIVRAEEREPTADDLADAELLVMYHTRRESSDAVRELLTDWIEGGKPTVVTHCGIGAYDDWPQFRQWLGRHWVWSNDKTLADKPTSGHPHVPCDLHVVSGGGGGFDPGFVTGWLPRDEVYVNLYDSAPVKDLVNATYDDGQTASIAWQAEGVDNVIVWAPGHLREIWHLPPMRTGLAACIRAVV